VTARVACAIPLSLFLVAGDASAADAVDLAASLIGRPYVWGAEGPSAFDCSGLTQYVFGEFGIDLPRRAISQSRTGEAVRRLRRGDLVFFSTDPGGSLVTHVGLYEARGVMIDASKRHGRVRRDTLDDPYWIDRFMFARRIASELRSAREEPRPGRTSRDGRRTAVRVLETLAGIWARKP
jgi:cell wall-associated NlpC family hydrolase